MLSEAEIKFWGCPELVESLLPFLDTFSTICLAQAHRFVLDIVLGKTVWRKLVKQVCHGMVRYQVMAWYQVTNILHSCLKLTCLLQCKKHIILKQYNISQTHFFR